MPTPIHLRFVLAFFAILAGAAGPATASTTHSELARGEELVQAKCFICHGAEGESSSPAFPRLAGQNANYVLRQLTDYKTGRRQSSTMQPMVEDLGEADFKALGAYFASRTTHGHEVADPELAAVGLYIYKRGNPDAGVAACAGCHGVNAHGSESLPRLAGQHAQYTLNQLKQFNKRQRNNDNAVMHGIASKLTELESKAVSAYLSGLK
jgi:cytochrome c553